MSVDTVRIGDVVLTRVGYADVLLDAARVGLTPEEVGAVAWAEPTWADHGQVRAGAAAWIIDDGAARIVVDPAFAADEILRNDADAAAHQEAFASILSAAGFPRESVTHAVATHFEGVGMLGWRNDDGSWSPFFPNAPILLSQRELDAFDAGFSRDVIGGFEALRAEGAVRAVTGDRSAITDAVSIEFTGCHSPGHQIVRVESGGDAAVVVGHLAVSPLHLATGECPPEHVDPAGAYAQLVAMRDSGCLLLGPLWPAPGAGRWDGARLVAIAPSTTIA
jgi:glyoxylase-like metal-dependent hydrolase (beta-lactamase superfamily II)